MLLDVAGTAGTIAIYYFIYKVIEEIADKHAVIDDIDKSVLASMCIGMLICAAAAVLLYRYRICTCTFSVLFGGIRTQKGHNGKAVKGGTGLLFQKPQRRHKKAVAEDCSSIEKFLQSI